jgi:transaldolase/glucose-6-phosphate isomerase
MAKNPLLELQSMGQSIWLDFIDRRLIESGELDRLIDEDGVLGMTSNPAIFEKSIVGNEIYTRAIEDLGLKGCTDQEIYERLTVADVQAAADHFRRVYERTGGVDGYVSLEVSPHLARDTQGTLAEARRLWRSLNRPNVLIKVPATAEGEPAIRTLISEGININVTLLFGLERYRQVAQAMIGGLRDRLTRRLPIDGIASVASFFLSRIDVLLDPQLAQLAEAGGSHSAEASHLKGGIAIASAKCAYSIYRELFESPDFDELRKQGGRPQRLLWASTSTKDPSYGDVKYVEALIGPETVNTIPMETLEAYRDHGHPAPRLAHDLEVAREDLDALSTLGIDLALATRQLEEEGIEKFDRPYDKLLQTIRQVASASPAVTAPADSLGSYTSVIAERLNSLQAQDFGKRLWNKDASLWKADPGQQDVIRNALGWLNVAENLRSHISDLKQFADEIRRDGFRHVVHMGMGGSSLAPMVFARTFSGMPDGLPLGILDTTDPAAIRLLESRLPLERTLFIVASKSGTTAEALAFEEYFFQRLRASKGDAAASNFIVITDPATPIVERARQRGYRRVFLNCKDIGGRFSALSYFGLVPAALAGIDISSLLENALSMAAACAPDRPAQQNPGLKLGAILGEVGLRRRDKVTLITTPGIDTFAMWLEQLLAESTGKEGTGLLPVAGETLGEPACYDDDRLFVSVALEGERSPEKALRRLEEAGHPVVRMQMKDRLELGGEFLRWEIATATAGALLGINAFDQPNVKESKDNTHRLLADYESRGQLEMKKPTWRDGLLEITTDRPATNPQRPLQRFFAAMRPGSYIALMAYLPEEPAITGVLQEIRLKLRDRHRAATTLGFGPRFLHSTGQYHKGGPNNGLFVQFTYEPGVEAPIPGKAYGFGVLMRAQAQGDLQALRQHGRPVIRVHLTGNVLDGLHHVAELL